MTPSDKFHTKINSLVDMPLPFGSSADAAAAAEETTLPLTFLNDFVFTAKGTLAVIVEN